MDRDRNLLAFLQQELQQEYKRGYGDGWNAALNRIVQVARVTPKMPGLMSAEEILDRPIEDLGLGERPLKCLKRHQVDTVRDLCAKTEESLLDITNFGQKALDDVILKLAAYGLELAKA